MKKWSEIIKVIPHDPIPADFDNDYKLTLNLVIQNCCTQFTEGRLCTCSKRSNIGTRIIKEENYKMSDKLTLNPKPGQITMYSKRRRTTPETAARENQCCWHGNNQRRKRSRSNTWSRQQQKSIMQWGCTYSCKRIRNRRKKAERALVLTDSCAQ